MTNQHEKGARSVKLVDLPLMTRLLENSIMLNSEQAFTGGMDINSPALLSSFLLRHRGTHTLLARAGKQTVVGQFRLRPDRHQAQIIYVAPGPEFGEDNTAWLHILDAMTAEAGRRGAHTLTAEVDEHLNLFETMRVADFSIYARQEIWQHAPGELPRLPVDTVVLT